MEVAPTDTRKTQVSRKSNCGFLMTAHTLLYAVAGSFSFFSSGSQKLKKKASNIVIAETMKIAVILTASINCPVMIAVKEKPAAP